MPAEVLTGFATAPGGTLTALTMSSGDSLTIRQSIKPKLMQAWADTQAVGILQILSPLIHDAVQGLRLPIVTSEVKPKMPMGIYQALQKGDTLTVKLSGSAVGGQIETAGLLVHYDSLEGAQGVFYDELQLRQAAVQPFVVQNTLATGVGGGWTGEEALNADFDVFKADNFYAMAGYVEQVEISSMGWRGTDTGNLRIGGPGDDNYAPMTAEWFVLLSRAYGIPMIPVFNANNKASIFVAGAQDQTGTNPVNSTILLQVNPEAAKQAAATPTPTSRAGPVARTAPTAPGDRRTLIGGAFGAPRVV